MKRSKRLAPIQHLAQSKEKTAAQALGQSLDNQKLEITKLEQLNLYRVEYVAQMQEKINQGVNFMHREMHTGRAGWNPHHQILTIA